MSTSDSGKPAEQMGGERIEALIAQMTLEEKIGQLNTPIIGWAGVVLKEGTGVQTEDPDSAPQPTSTADAEALVRGEYEEGIGPVSGLYLLNGFQMDGMTLDEQAQEYARFRRIAQGTRLGIPLFQLSEGNHGLWASGATIFPQPLAFASTWDLDLVRDIYRATAKEARASGANMLNTIFPEPARDPRPGRVIELHSECPYQTGRMIEAAIFGCSGNDPSAADKVGVWLPAFPASTSPSGGLERGPIELSERALRETYFPGWIAGIGAGALCVMATWNTVDGDSAPGSKWWLTDVLREELGFDGFIVSEAMGFSTLLVDGVAETQEQAGRIAIDAGIELSITYEEGYRRDLLEGVREGAVEEAAVDQAVRHLLETKEKLGLFDEPLEANTSLSQGRPPEHRELALKAAREGLVLLKNEGGLLPLSKELAKVAVIGPLADDSRSLLGDQIATTILQEVTSIAEAIAATPGLRAEVVHQRGCEVIGGDAEEIAAAVEAAAEADVAVLVVGERIEVWPNDGSGRNTMGELADHVSLDLTGHQQRLVEAVHATGTPTVVILINGHPLSVRWIAENVPAILEGWAPGERGGEAIADILFGDHEPGGRLTITIPRHVGQLPLTYDHKWQKHSLEDHEYAYVGSPTSPLFAFGHGLSYTEFEYADLAIEMAANGARELLTVRVAVENTGTRTGCEVVQLYVSDRVSSLATPVQRLAGFEKIELGPGERKEVALTVYPEQLALFDKSRRWVVEAGAFDLQVGRSCQDIRLRDSFSVAAEIEVPGNFPLGTSPAAR